MNREAQLPSDLQSTLKVVGPILNLVSDAAAVVDCGGLFVFCNPAAQRDFGWLPSNTKSFLDIIGVHSADRQRIAKYLAVKKQADPVRIEQVPLQIKDGATTWCSISISKVCAKGETANVILIRDQLTRDLSRNQIKNENAIEALTQAKESAETASYAKIEFLAGVSHEIRTPLSAILGYSEILMDPRLSISNRLNHTMAIRRNGEMLSRIINDILDLSKVEAGKLKIEKQDTNLNEILSDVMSVLGLKAAEKKIQLAVRCTDRVPHFVHTDPLRLRQILLNIVGNAIKFTDRGLVEVVVDMRANLNDIPKLVFEVKDTGVGLTEAQARKLFQPFAQAHASSQQRGGTGLGMILAQRLARLLGGDVELVKSSPGVGSHFRITIDPAGAQGFVYNDKADKIRIADANRKVSGEDRLDGLRVLLAEDSPDNQIIVGQMLKMAGAEVVTVDNGQAALERLHNNEYDVVLMDIQMPVMDGFEAIGRLRQEGYGLPVIALTAHAMREEREKCLECGFTDHISKPIDRLALIQRLADVCSVIPSTQNQNQLKN